MRERNLGINEQKGKEQLKVMVAHQGNESPASCRFYEYIAYLAIKWSVTHNLYCQHVLKVKRNILKLSI